MDEREFNTKESGKSELPKRITGSCMRERRMWRKEEETRFRKMRKKVRDELALMTGV